HHKLEAELAERESILKNLEEELAFLQTCKPRLDELQQDYQAKRSKAVELTSALDDLKIHNALDEQKVSNLLIIREANRPLSKSGPNRTSYIVMGLAVGLLAGFALAFLRNAIDGTLHRPQDVDRHLGHRILGVVPETRGWRKAQREARQQVRTGPRK
ncbi:MAG: hypothetical protein ACE5GW_11765, partial [Planctomycetota bacterium]